MTSAVFGDRAPTAHKPRRVAAMAAVVFAAVAAGAGRLLKPRSASIRNLRSMPLTTAGLACIDMGVFQASTVAGWIVTGLSLVALEYFIADEA